MALEISPREKEGIAILDVTGELAGEDARLLHLEVKAQVLEGKHKLALNLAGVELIDNVGLGGLAASFVSVQRVDGRLSVFGAPSAVRLALQAVRLDQVIELHKEEEEALAGMG